MLKILNSIIKKYWPRLNDGEIKKIIQKKSILKKEQKVITETKNFIELLNKQINILDDAFDDNITCDNFELKFIV